MGSIYDAFFNGDTIAKFDAEFNGNFDTVPFDGDIEHLNSDIQSIIDAIVHANRIPQRYFDQYTN